MSDNVGGITGRRTSNHPKRKAGDEIKTDIRDPSLDDLAHDEAKLKKREIEK